MIKPTTKGTPVHRSPQRLLRSATIVSFLALSSLASIGCSSAAGDLRGTERGRELDRLSKKTLGAAQVPLTRFGWWVNDTADRVTGETAGKYARLMESANPDSRRNGITWLAEKPFGERPPYTTRYAQIAQHDPDYLVRATAIRALNRSRDKTATPVFIKALSDPNEQVRLEAAKALNRVPDPAAADALLALLRKPDESKDVRIAAADALKYYKSLEVARGLASMLGERDFGIAWQSHRSLRDMTGKDLKYDEGAWLTFLTGPEKPLG